MFQTKVVEEIKTHILCSVPPPPLKSCRLWDNVRKYGTAGKITDNTTRRMHYAFWMKKAAGTHSEYVIRIAFPSQQWLRERILLLHCQFTACLVIIHDPKIQFWKLKIGVMPGKYCNDMNDDDDDDDDDMAVWMLCWPYLCRMICFFCVPDPYHSVHIIGPKRDTKAVNPLELGE